MLGSKGKLVITRMLRMLALMLLFSGTGNAEQLPLKIYTTADGLAHNTVNRVVRDSRGFLWFCTNEGLSRFDGYSFTNFGIDEGLPSAVIKDLLETREGGYWVATADGLCRFNPLGKLQANTTSKASHRNMAEAMFTVYSPGDDARSKHVLSLLQDRTGSIWCGTRNGLYRLEDVAGEMKFTLIDLGIAEHFESRFIECLLEDRQGALWVGSRHGLYRRWTDGRIEAYSTRDGLPSNLIFSLLEDSEGRIWVGTGFEGLCFLVPDPTPGRMVVARDYTERGGATIYWINQLFQATDGSLWAGSMRGLLQFIPTTDGRDFRFRAYTEAHGLSFHEVKSLAQDRNGNLWLAMLQGGVAKIARNGFTTFGKTDGIVQSASIMETRAGEVLGISYGSEGLLNRFDGEKFISIRLQLPKFVKKLGVGWGWNQTLLEDHMGEWWIATFAGLCRFPKVSNPEQLAHTPPKAIYTTREGLASDKILRLFEDSRGDLWIGTVGHSQQVNGLSRWERKTNTFHHYSEKDNLPRFNQFFVTSFAEDRTGNLWIGFNGEGGLARYRDGRFTLFTANDGVPTGQIRNMYVDSAGRLWLANTQSGLSRIDDPSAEHPQLVTYTTAEGLSSNEVTIVNEDELGRFYIGTGRGIDRLNIQTGRIKHYTAADGMPLNGMLGTLRDRKGKLWFSFANGGVARLAPEFDPPPVPPPILITGLHIAGEVQPVSALGETVIAPIELSADKNQLQIDFVALGFSPGEGLRYQYKLEGTSVDWSHLAEQRTVNFANLASGRYRFQVRAVNADGVISQSPAILEFVILPPFWQRWYFIGLALVLPAMLVYLLYRYRVNQLIDMERVRTRIATDLHDDIGSSLSQIAILSEVIRQQVSKGNLSVNKPLSTIATTSRELVDSMSDIVWAINPGRDHLSDLATRMREFAGDILTSRNIEFDLDAPGNEQRAHIDTDMRREVFLIFKEAVNNLARHSQCSQARIEFFAEDSWINLMVSDDGSGFDPCEQSDGHGLASMRRRANLIGGKLTIVSASGKGTDVRLRAPMRPRRRFWKKSPPE